MMIRPRATLWVALLTVLVGAGPRPAAAQQESAAQEESAAQQETEAQKRLRLAIEALQALEKSQSKARQELSRSAARYVNDEGKMNAYIGTSAEGHGLAAFYNKAGFKTGYVGSSDQGDGHLRLFDGEDGLRVYLGSSGRGNGHATFYDQHNQEVVTVGSRSGRDGVGVRGKWARNVGLVLPLATRAGILPGSLLSVVDAGGALMLSTEAYDPKVVGVVSGARDQRPGVDLGRREDGTSDVSVAVSGAVAVRVNAEGGPIVPGSLLVSSSTPGVAMCGNDRQRLPGTVVGKALEGFEPADGQDAQGLVLMLVMLR
jgi:hypothetical protein